MSGKNKTRQFRGFASQSSKSRLSESSSVLSSESSQNQKLFVHLDYLRVKIIINRCYLDELLTYCDPKKYIAVVESRPWSAGSGCPYYANSIVSPLGINGGFDEDLETGICQVMLEFSGDYFRSVELINQWRFLIGLKHHFTAICCRLDIAIDDVTYSKIPIDSMLAACDAGNNFGFRKQGYSGSGDCGKKKQHTDYFGSRTSGKFVRVYDHDKECMRFEAEFKRQYSRLIFDFITTIDRRFVGTDMEEELCMDAIDNYAKIMGKRGVHLDVKKIWDGLHGCENRFELLLVKILGSIAVNALDFRDRSTRKDKSKASRKDTKRLAFYQKFIDLVGEHCVMKPLQDTKAFSKTIAWMQRQVSKTMSIIKQGLGTQEFSQWVRLLAKQGGLKCSTLDLKLIALIRDNPQICNLKVT